MLLQTSRTVLEFAASSRPYDALRSPSQQEVTQLLEDWSGGDEGALEKLIPLMQPELHRLAHHYMSRERAWPYAANHGAFKRGLPAVGR